MRRNWIVSNSINGPWKISLIGIDIDYISFGMVIADDQYYKKPLEARRDILSAPSIDFLCKTIVFENNAYD